MPSSGWWSPFGKIHKHNIMTSRNLARNICSIYIYVSLEPFGSTSRDTILPFMQGRFSISWDSMTKWAEDREKGSSYKLHIYINIIIHLYIYILFYCKEKTLRKSTFPPIPPGPWANCICIHEFLGHSWVFSHRLKINNFFYWAGPNGPICFYCVIWVGNGNYF